MSGALGKFSEVPKHIIKEYIDTILTDASLLDKSSNLVDLSVDSDFVDTSDISFDHTNKSSLEFGGDIYDTIESKTSIGGGYLDGPGNCIYVQGSATYIDVFIKIEGYGFKQIKLKPYSNNWDNGNFLKFIVKDVQKIIPATPIKNQDGSISYAIKNTVSTNSFEVFGDMYDTNSFNGEFENDGLEVIPSRGSFTTYVTTKFAEIDLTDINGTEVYIRNDSPFHYWFRNNKAMAGKSNFINDRKQFIYFGDAYVDNDATNGDIVWNITHQGIKDFAVNVMPPNDVNDKMKVLIETFFDKFYQESYSLQKNLVSLIDAKEIDFKFLGYLGKQYGIDIDRITGDVTEDQLRYFIYDAVNLLKRKGSYASIYIIWRTLTGRPQDSLKIYDRWHSTSITTSPSAGTGPLGWKDYEYTKMYDKDHKYPLMSGDSWGPIVSSNVIAVPTLTCVIDHDLHTSNILVECYDTHSNKVTPTAITKDSIDRVTVSFSTNFSGIINISTAQTVAVSGMTNTITHNLNTTNILVQCFDMGLVKVYPQNISITDVNNIIVNFNTMFTGYISVTSGSYSYPVESGTNQCIINHGLNTYDLLIDAYDDSGNSIELGLVQMLTANSVQLTSLGTSGLVGRVIIEEAEKKIKFDIPLQTWTVNHNLGYSSFIIEAYDSSNSRIYPKTLTMSSTNKAVLTFETETSGFVVVKSVGQKTTDLQDAFTQIPLAGMTLSTHYKVEIDHNLRPVSDTAIMDQQTLNTLMYGWGLIRPVNRVAHYSQIVSPVTDFSGNTFTLYNTLDVATWKTKYVANPTSFPGLIMQNASNPVYSMTIIHALNKREIVVQCYDNDLFRVYPVDITLIDANICSLTFSSAFTGTVFICVPDYDAVVSSGTIWNVNHGLSSKFNIVETYYPTEVEYNSSLINLVDINNLTVTNQSATDGVITVRKGDYVHTQSSASTVWDVIHNLNYIGVMVDVFGSSFNQIKPLSIELVNSTSCRIVFPVATSGTAVIKMIGEPAIKKQTVDALTNGMSFFELGDGSTSSWDARVENDVESEIYRDYLLPQNVTVDDSPEGNYYFTITIPKGIEVNIKELAIFSYKVIPAGGDIDLINDKKILFYTSGAGLFKHKDSVLTIRLTASKTGLA